MIPADKLGHLKVGLLVAAFALGSWALLALAGLVQAADAGVAAALAGITAGLTKEAADWLDNQAAAARGAVPLHGVELMDALATALPGLVCAIAPHVI